VDEPKVGLRERTRNAVRAQLAEAALKLFVEQGFEATTVEQIAAVTGLSRRSFHRYFSSKEDVLGQWFAEMGQQIAAALAARPHHEHPWLALRRAFDDLVQGMSTRPEARVMTRMMLDTPALHASHLHKYAHWRVLIADVLQHRLAEGGSRPARIAAVALAGAALASLESAQSEWVSEGNQRPLDELTDEAMNAVAPLTGPAPNSRQRD
jgi:AcrR family transcriptional regulator